MIVVFSNYLTTREYPGLMFRRNDHLGVAEDIACQIMVLLGAGDVVLLQHNAGDVISGGPVPAHVVKNQIPFDRIAKATGEAEEQVRGRLIVFALTPEEAEGGMPVIRLQDVFPMSEIQGLSPEHPLSQILELATQARSEE
jgi:hypothetical protein